MTHRQRRSPVATFFITFVVLLVCAAIGVAIFLATFDANRYRPMLVSELEKALGRPVALQRLSLGWRNGVAIELQALTIFERSQSEPEPLLQVESASAVVHLVPLLRKQLQISSVLLRRPRIRVSRDAQGQVNVVGLMAAGSPAAAATPPPSSAGGSSGATSPITIDIDSFLVVDGALHWTDAMTQPPTELSVKALDVRIMHIAAGRPMDFDIQGALASDTQNLQIAGRLTPPLPPSPGSIEQLTVTIDGLALQRVLPPPAAGQPEVRGALTVRLQGRVENLEPAAVARSISGSGTVRISDPVIANFNVLRAVLERITMIPGLLPVLELQLPPTYQQQLAVRDTVFSPIDVAAKVDNGVVAIDSFAIRTSSYGMTGHGTLNLDGKMEVHPLLHIEPSLSAAMVRGVRELQGLLNAQGQIEIPLLAGPQPPYVWPDLDVVAQRVIVPKAADLLNDLLKRLQGDKTPSQQTPSDVGNPSQPPDPLRNLLRSLQQPTAPAPTSSQ